MSLGFLVTNFFMVFVADKLMSFGPNFVVKLLSFLAQALHGR